MFFGWVNGDFPELGYFSLSEMQTLTIIGIGSDSSSGAGEVIASDARVWKL